MIFPPLGIIGLLALAIYLIGKLLKYAKRYLDDIHTIAENSKKRTLISTCGNGTIGEVNQKSKHPTENQIPTIRK